MNNPQENDTKSALWLEMLARREYADRRRRELNWANWLAEAEKAHRDDLAENGGESFNGRPLARLRFVTAAEQSYAEASKAYEKALEDYDRAVNEPAADDEEIEP